MLSGSCARRKRAMLVSSFYRVDAGLAIDSGLDPEAGSDLLIGSRVHGRETPENVSLRTNSFSDFVDGIREFER